MSSPTLAVPSAFHAPLFASPAVSSEAREVDELLRHGEGDRGVGYALAQDALLNELRQLAIDCSVPDWDGHGARPIDDRSVYLASLFIAGLPLFTPLPEIGVDPDGEVSLDWHVRARHSLSISIGGDGSLAYAALFGTSRMRGVEVIDGGVPETIMAALHRLFPRTG